MLKLLGRLARFVKVARAVKAINAVFSRIGNPGPSWAGTFIPRFFEFSTKGGKVFVNPNATKHIAQFLVRGSAGQTKMASSLILSDLEAAITQAFKQRIQFDEKMAVGNWESIFTVESATAPDLVPTVLKHALYIP